MSRYFIEVAYKGSAYAGFQIQDNANTVQKEVEKAMRIYFRLEEVQLTGSSRTDAGVHAEQNFFHFDTAFLTGKDFEKSCYHINAILPSDIVIKGIMPVADDAHCRFDAISRSYEYTVYQTKDPFLSDRGYYYPFALDMGRLTETADLIKSHRNFKSFSKKNTQVHTFDCNISESEWVFNEKVLIYRVTGNRFLRGMVRGLVGTMLLAGRGKYSGKVFKQILDGPDASQTDFSAPPHGLILKGVKYPRSLF